MCKLSTLVLGKIAIFSKCQVILTSWTCCGTLHYVTGPSLARQKWCLWLTWRIGHSATKASDPTSQQVKRTSYWSESSNISLVVLDNHAVVFHKVYASAPSTQPLFTNKFTMFIGPDSSLVGESILFLLCSHLNKGERERKPHCQKLCTQVTYVWGNCRCHPRRCAMSQDSI